MTMRLVEIITHYCSDGMFSEKLRNLSVVIRPPEKGSVTCINMSTIKHSPYMEALRVQKALDFKTQYASMLFLMQIRWKTAFDFMY